MHQTVFYMALSWMAVLLAVGVLLIIRARLPLMRVLMLDTLAVLAIGLFALFALERGRAYYLDAGLVLALLSFLATVAAARYLSEGTFF